MKAPNGQPSNLTPEQYKLVRTKAFKDWFGDWENDPENASKVVDENGEPRLVYHGTNQKFTIFNLEKVGSNVDYGMWGSGFYFSPIKSFSKGYGNILMKVFLNVRNPFVRNPNLTGSKTQFKPVYGKEQSIQLRNDILNANFDGVIQYESGRKNLITQIIAFHPEQIKLADGSNTTFDGSNPDIRFDKGGQVNSNSFMKWYIDWYKGISDKMFIAISLPTIVTPFKEKNVLILDVFEKKDQSIDAKPYLKKIVEKADEYGVVIYLEPNPRHKYFQDNTEKKNKITKEYLVDYYQRFGFELTPNKQFMKRVPHFAEGGSLPNLLHIVIENVNPEKKYFGHYKKIFDIIEEDIALYNPYGTEDEKMIGNDFHIWISPIPDNDKIEKIKKLKGVRVLSNYYAEGGSVKRHNKEIMKKIKRGGITYGASHDNGGIPVKNASTGDMLEVEGGEGIVNKRSMASGKKVKLNGQEMTICEAVSQLNQMEGGVSFSCDDVEDMQFIEEMALGGELERGVRTEKEHIQVLKDLYSKRITPNEATRKIAEDHLKEDERYYSKLAKMEGKMAKGGSVSTLLAPNGKPSNLNAEQYHLVRTPEFKAWFGDWEKLAMAKVKDPAMDEVTLANLSKDVSKVVDENGEPLVVYHTSSNEINVFRVDSKINTLSGKTINTKGAYFTANPKMYQYKGGNIIKCFLNIKNPIITTDQLFSGLINEDKYRMIIERGSDGVVLNLPFINEKNTEIVVFQPNQIKLADGSNTTFDGSNPDIRFDDGGETDEDNLSYAEAQERWNKKAGIPSQKEALAFVKENPEILAMLKNGGEIMDCGCGSYGNGGYVDTFVDERIVSKVEDKDNPFAKFGLKKNFRGDTFVRLDAIEEKSINFCDSFPQVCGKNMGILREDMPQIYEEYIPEYLDFLQDMGVDAKLEYDIPVKELTATQEDISVPRMSRMLKRLLSGYYIDSDGNRINPLKRKLIITKDNYVLDGHHRWATMYFLSPNNTIDALRVNADIKDIVPISKNFGMVQFQKFMYGGKVGVIGFTNSDGLGVEVNASSLKYLKITRNIFPKAGLKISPLITYNNDTLPTMVFSDNGFQIDDVGKRNLKFNRLWDMESSLSSNVNDAIADYNLSIPDKYKQIFLENVGYATSFESGLLNVRAILKRVNQIDTPAISIYFYQYKSASITFSFIFNDKFIELYGDDLDVLEAILNGFSQTFKDSDNMDALVIDGNFTRSRKPRTAKTTAQPTQQPTQQGGYWRFKTEEELKDEYGSNWRMDIQWRGRGKMDYLLGQRIEDFRLENGQPKLGQLNTKDAYGITSGKDDTWNISNERVFKFVPETTQAPTPQGGYWRFKTEQELKDLYGDNWMNNIQVSTNDGIYYLLGQKIDNDKLGEDGKPKVSPNVFDTIIQYGITSGGYDDEWIINDERIFKFVPETTQQATQQGGYWRFKTEEELVEDYPSNWRKRLGWNSNNQMDYLLGKRIEDFRLVNGKPKLGSVNTKDAYGIASGVDDDWIINDLRLFKFVSQSANSQLVPTKELDKKIQEVQDLMNSELFSPDEVVVQQVLIDELKKLNEQKQKSILSNYYSNDLNDLLQLYAQNISKGQRTTMDSACGKDTPSGVPSELDETQYALVRTPQFKAWFGDWEEAYKTKNYSGVSKAINEKTGEPLVVYHGKGNMKVEATYFKLTGFPIKYFAENKSYSEWFKNNYNAVNILYEFFINVSNPIDLSMVALDEITPQTFVDLIEALYDYKIQTPLMMPDRAVKVWQILRGNPKMLTEIKEKTNYDGFIIFENNPQDIVNGEENITKDFIAYENNQYKSADGRNTTFFMDVEDFRFEKGGVTQHTL